MLKSVLFVLVLACIVLVASVRAEELVLFDFQDPATHDMKWVQEEASNPVLTVAPLDVTSNDFKLRMTLKGGKWPGFTMPTPKDWSGYEVLRFDAYCERQIKLAVRIDDRNSTNYQTRFNHSFDLKPGHNLCQIDLKAVGSKLDIRNIRAFVLFCSNPPNPLDIYLDNFVLGDMAGEEVPFIPYAERRDLQPKMEIETPHFPLAKPLAGGPVRSFFLTSIDTGREVVEMMQRMAIEPSVMHWDPAYDHNTWGMGDFYGKRGHKTDFVLMQKYLASSMQGPEEFESLLLFTPQGWERFGKSARDAILKRVKEKGEGLVLVFPFPGVENGEWPADLRELSALIDSESDYPNSAGYVKYASRGRVKGEAWRTVGDHPITRGVPLAALPFEAMEYQQYKVAPGATVLIESAKGDPVLAVRQVGKGRVATFAYRSEGLTPRIRRERGALPVRPYRYWEVIYSLLNRTSLWCAGREMTMGGTLVEIEEAESDTLVARMYTDESGMVTDWALKFTPPAESRIKPLAVTAPAAVDAGAAIPVTLAFDETLQALQSAHPAATLRVRLLEDALGRERTLARHEASLAEVSQEMTVELPTHRVGQILARAMIDVLDGETLIGRGEAEVLVTPDTAPWEDYETLMWNVDGLPFMREVEDKLVRQFGATGVMETGWKNPGQRMRWARAGLRLMVHDLSRSQLHLTNFDKVISRYSKSKSKADLVRKPSFADSAWLAKERARVVEAVQALKPFHPTNYVLCDEPSLTNYRVEFDFDFHPENIERFRTAMEAKFKTVENLNQCLGTEYANFGDIEPPVTAEARKNRQWPLWNEWRAHNDTIMAEGYRMYKEAVQSVDPKGTISVSGTQIATPFDGFDWYKIAPHFGTMQGYGYGDQERKRMSFADGMMINATPAGYGRSGRAVDYQIWDVVSNHGGGHVLFWWIAFRNPDLTFCQSAYDYMRIFGEMRRGIGRQYLLARRTLSPIAIQYSMNSMRAGFMLGKDYHGPHDKASAALVSAGYDPIYMADEQIAAGELIQRGIKVLVMPAPLSLGVGANQGKLNVLESLRAFQQQGGLILLGTPPQVDEHLQPLEDVGVLAPIAQPYGELDASALAKVGALVQPLITIGGNSEAVLQKIGRKVHMLQGREDAHLVTILRPPVGTREVVGGDGVVHVVPDKSGGNEIESLTADLSALPGTQYYLPRKGTPASVENGVLSLKMQAGDGVPVAVLPYAVTGVSVTATPIENGNLRVTWSLQGSERYVSHAVRISVRDGDAEDPVLSTNATTDPAGSGAVTLRLAEEDRGRTLTIQVQDVLTGVRSNVMTIKVAE